MQDSQFPVQKMYPRLKMPQAGISTSLNWTKSTQCDGVKTRFGCRQVCREHADRNQATGLAGVLASTSIQLGVSAILAEKCHY